MNELRELEHFLKDWQSLLGLGALVITLIGVFATFLRTQAIYHIMSLSSSSPPTVRGWRTDTVLETPGLTVYTYRVRVLGYVDEALAEMEKSRASVKSKAIVRELRGKVSPLPNTSAML